MFSGFKEIRPRMRVVADGFEIEAQIEVEIDERFPCAPVSCEEVSLYTP